MVKVNVNIKSYIKLKWSEYSNGITEITRMYKYDTTVFSPQ